jgi:hypothetical protein
LQHEQGYPRRKSLVSILGIEELGKLILVEAEEDQGNGKYDGAVNQASQAK